MDDAPLRQGAYVAYMLRLWQTGSQDGCPIWRASLEHAHTGQRLVFGDVKALLAFLTELTTSTAETKDPLQKNERPANNANELLPACGEIPCEQTTHGAQAQ